jgi:hypothetical protein
MKIDRHLNLVIPIERDGGPLYVHSVPLALPVFQRYALVISRTFSLIYQQGLNFVAGPRVAAMLLQQVAESLGQWDGPEGVENGLLGEIRRTSQLIAPTESGWRGIPLQAAMARGMLDEEELSEVEGLITFFTVASAMHRGIEKKLALDGMAAIWEVLLSPLTSTAYSASLPTLTPAASSGVTAAPSSIPS